MVQSEPLRDQNRDDRRRWHIEKDEEDIAREEARKNYLEFMNSSVR